MEGPLIAVPASFTGMEEAGPNAEALARRIGEPQILPPDVPAVRQALEGRPVVVASECVVALATLPWLAEHHPEARVLWLDAHADFNTPGTSPSGYTGGMPVAGATGQFDAGVTPILPAERIVFFGLRDVDPGERELLDRSGATVAQRSDEVLEALGDGPVLVHLDPDVVDGYPCAFPTPPGGPTADELRDLLTAVARRNEVVCVTAASVGGPPEIPHHILEPLL